MTIPKAIKEMQQNPTMDGQAQVMRPEQFIVSYVYIFRSAALLQNDSG